MATQCGEEGGVMRSDVQGEVCVPAAGGVVGGECGWCWGAWLLLGSVVVVGECGCCWGVCVVDNVCCGECCWW